MKRDIPLKIFTVLKIEAVHTLQQIKRLSASNFNVRPDDRDIQYCQVLIHLSTQYRHIATCLIYAACNELTATQADGEVKQHCQDTASLPINTEYADRYKQQLDTSVQYVEQLLAGTFNQLHPTKIRFSHCADLAHYNELLSQTTNTFIQYTQSIKERL
jgi:hypothetical protein